MSEKKKFLLRLDSEAYTALEKWAADDLRSINSQIEFILIGSLKKTGRWKTKSGKNEEAEEDEK